MGEHTSGRAVRTVAAAAIMLAISGASATAGISAAGPETETTATAAATKIVKVRDDRYSPMRLRVARGTRIRWVWARGNGNYHDVYLNRRPKGARRFYSGAPARPPFSFTRKLRKPGRYTVLCTVHEGMNMRIHVAR